MATVPTVEAPQVTPSSSPQMPYQTGAGNSPDAFGAQVGNAQQAFGGQIEKVGNVLAQHANALQLRKNQAEGADLFLQSTTESADVVAKFDALQGRAKMDALPDHIKELETIRQKYAGLASNGEVEHLFTTDFKRRQGFMIGDAAKGAATGFKQYERDGRVGKSMIAQQDAAAAQDDATFETRLAEVRKTAAEESPPGESAPEVAEVKVKTAVAAAWSQRFDNTVLNNPVRAKDMLVKNKESFDPTKFPALLDKADQAIIHKTGSGDASEWLDGQLSVSKTLVDRVKKLEDYRATPYSDFKQTSSGYGTKYQAGDENIPPEQLKAVHEQRLTTELSKAADLVDKFSPGLPAGTREALISLTYNAGPGWQQSGLGSRIKQGDLEGAKTNFAEYVRAGGQEMDALRSRRQTELSWWGGSPTSSDRMPEAQMSHAMEQAKVMAAQRFPDNPDLQAQYAQQFTSSVQTKLVTMKNAATEMQRGLSDIVHTEVYDPATKPTTIEALSPQAQDAFYKMTPLQKVETRTLLAANAQKEEPASSAQKDNYTYLTGQAALNPKEFFDRDLSQEDITPEQRRQLGMMKIKREETLQKGAKETQFLSSPLVAPLLKDAGAQNSSSPAARKKYEEIGGAYVIAKKMTEDNLKRPITESEAKDIVVKLTREHVLKEGWIFNDTTTGAKALLNKTPLRASTPEEAAGFLPGTPYVTSDGRKFIR